MKGQKVVSKRSTRKNANIVVISEPLFSRSGLAFDLQFGHISFVDIHSVTTALRRAFTAATPFGGSPGSATSAAALRRCHGT
jgi:hypothetical protein